MIEKTKICPNCNKEFDRWMEHSNRLESLPRWKKRVFCNRKCFNQYKGMKLLEGKKRTDSKTGKEFQIGDIRVKNGKKQIFTGYRTKTITYHGPNKGFYKEIWMEPAKWENMKLKGAEAKASHREKVRSGEIIGTKRLNPKTKKPFKKGDVDNKGNIFHSYMKQMVKKNGYFYERWFTPENYSNERIRLSIYSIVTRSKKNKIPCNIDYEYALSIFPKNLICPVLGTKMSWGTTTGVEGNSPSLDRIIPEKGYTKGNVEWISQRANILKNNATIDEVRKLEKWLAKKLKKV